MTKHSFKKDHQSGKRGEAIFADYLSRKGFKFEDVSENKEYQDDDVDFVVESKLGKKVSFEVKNDSMIHKTGNIFYESISNVDHNTVGCFEKTKSEFMVICSEPSSVFYIAKSDFLREYVKENKNNLRYISRVPGSNSAGYLIPVKNIRDNVKILSFN